MEQPVRFGEHNKQEDPPMHSAEHLINGFISRMLGCGRAFSTHIEKKKSKCDFYYNRNLTPDELKETEMQVNRQIASHADVWDEILPVGQAKRQYALSRLPEGEQWVRIVHIGGFDSCPCVGGHVRNTAEIPPVRLISSDWKEGVLRVRFKFTSEQNIG